MLRRLSSAGLGIALCVVSAGVGAAATVVTGPVDQAGFQALIDAASPGDTIVCLGGIYDFGAPGPIWIDKGLTIRAADAADPPIFRGDPGSVGFLANWGFVQEVGSFIDGLTLRGLRFEDFDRALAFPLAADLFTSGCPVIPGAGAKRLRVLDNTFRATRRALQIIGGPMEDFVFRGNDAEFVGGTSGILVIGGWEPCPADDWALVEAPRPVKGTIQGNSLRGDALAAIVVDGAEQMSVQENLIEDVLLGVFFADTKGWFATDDGPIRLGSVKENVIYGALFAIIAEGPTTITRTEIKDNQITGGLIGILLDFGANGFELKANDFSDVVYAEVYLGLDEENSEDDICGPGVAADLFACAPETFDNVVKVSAGDRVFDFGSDNVVKIVD